MKVAIVCGSPSSEFMAPYHDKSVEIWVLGNRVDRHLNKRVTRIFEIHENLTEHGDVGAYKAKLYQLAKKYEVVVGETFGPSCPNVVPYPYNAAEQLFGSLYLTSSPAYMIAYALLKGATEIGLYGVDLSISDHEYFWQRPCVEAWIGFAKGKGVKVFIPEVSHVGKSVYCEGRDWGNEKSVGVFSEDGFSALADQHQQKHDALQEQRRNLALEAAMHDGGVQVLRNLAKVARAVEANVPITNLLDTTVIR